MVFTWHLGAVANGAGNTRSMVVAAAIRNKRVCTSSKAWVSDYEIIASCDTSSHISSRTD